MNIHIHTYKYACYSFLRLQAQPRTSYDVPSCRSRSGLRCAVRGVERVDVGA